MTAPRFIVCDFETYYSKDYHLNPQRKGGLSTPLYIMDPRFKVHGMAVDDGENQWFVPEAKVRETLEKYKNDILVFHNAFFDLGILAWHYQFRPAFVVDTLLLANHVLGSARDSAGGSNSLANLARKLALPLSKGTELKNFEGVRDPDEMQFEVLGAYARNDAKLTRMVLNKLLPEVTNQEFELWLLDHTLRIYTEKLLGIDLEKLAVVKAKVKARLEDLIQRTGLPPETLSGNKAFEAELRSRLAAAGMKFPTKKRPYTDHEKLKAKEKRVALGKLKTVPALSKQDPQFVRLTECGVPAVEVLVQARLASKSASTVMARLDTMEAFGAKFGGIPVHLVYYGAHTGRFSGGGGFNFQNLTSPGRAATPFDREVATLVRECITPLDAGDVFVAVDAAQIEARILAWLAGEPDLLEQFSRNLDVYSIFISDVVGREVRKPRETDPPDVAAKLKLDRQVGKTAVLGLGYGMGKDKFAVRLKAESKEVAKLFESGEMDEEQAAGIVAAYREKHPAIVQLWADVNAAFMDAINGATRRVGPLVFRRHGPRAVSITLPNGRKLYYRDLRSRRVDNKFGGGKKTEWLHGAGQKIYGGLLVENIVQAIARDVLAEQGILAAEQAGYKVALHVHDEVVCQVPAGDGQRVHDFLIGSLSTAPEWGQGMPLSAEGGIARNLSK